MLKSIKLTGTTSAGGAVTITATRSILARLYAVEWIDGTFDDGVDGTLSFVQSESEVDTTLLTLTDANSDAWYYPRALVHDASGTALTGTAGGDRTLPVINGTLKLVIAQGGNAKTGGCIVYYCD